MANETIRVLGTEAVIEDSGATVTNGSFAAMTEGSVDTAAIGGFPMATIEIDLAAGAFSAAPTAGAMINVYERPYNSDGNQGPLHDADYKGGYLGSIVVDPADVQQYFSLDFPVNHYGGTYALEWVDGGAGTAEITLGWAARLIPWTYGPAA